MQCSPEKKVSNKLLVFCTEFLNMDLRAYCSSSKAKSYIAPRTCESKSPQVSSSNEFEDETLEQNPPKRLYVLLA